MRRNIEQLSLDSSVNTKLIGHEVQRARLKQMFVNNKLPSTMMFAGVSGIGKRLVARELARTLLCAANSETGPRQAVYGGCSECKNCHILDSGNCPDYYEINCLDRDESSVEHLRELLYSLHLSTFSSKSRVIIFNDSEYLSIQGANLMLKSLEEPRRNTYFIIVCANPSRLPATLLSRCQIWFFDTLRAEQVQAILADSKEFGDLGLTTQEELREASLLADGSLDNFKRLSQHREFWMQLQRMLDDIFWGNTTLASELALDLAKDKENLNTSLQVLRTIARQRMLSANDHDAYA
ncbi:MAG: hypothetical protein DCC75_02895, partial [Proteobacteria bacterium]